MAEGRRRRRRSTAAELVAALAIAATAAPALAGETGTDLGSSNGINYRVSAFEDFSGPALSNFVDCLVGDVAISGGINLGGTSDQGRMGSSARATTAFEGTARTWRSTGVNLAGGVKDMDFYGVCKESGRKGTRIVMAKRMVDPGEKGTAKVRCPDGYRVIGGGVISADPIVLATVPFDGGDSDDETDDGWKASAINNQGVARPVKAQAICRKAGTWSLAYIQSGVGLIANGTTAYTRLCPNTGVAVGGGGAIIGPAGTGRIFETFPHDSGDMDVTPSEGWTAELKNLSASPQQGTVDVICKR
jgi:hypothetical protein